MTFLLISFLFTQKHQSDMIPSTADRNTSHTVRFKVHKVHPHYH